MLFTIAWTIGLNQRNLHLMDLGQLIRSRRQELRLTQQALADMSGVSARMVKSIEGNYANPSIRTIEKLLSPLGLRIEIIENA